MAFNRNELSMMAYTGASPGLANHLWFYANSADDNLLSAAVADSFFDDVADQMRTDDVIFIANVQAIRFIDVTAGVVTLVDPDVTQVA